MAGGRPTDYRPEYCDRVIEMGKRGFSIVEMCAEIECDRSTLEKAWPEKHEEFSQALMKARLHSQAWWENVGREWMVEIPGGPKLNSSIWSRSMAARFPNDWREQSKVEHSGKIETAKPARDLSGLSDDELAALETIEAKVARAGTGQ